MGNRIKLFVLAASAAAIVGCQQTANGPLIEDKAPPARQNISINELAAALGLRVSESKPTHVTLKNSSNTVMIFTLSGGKIYVNTRPIGEVGQVDRIGGQIHPADTLGDAGLYPPACASKDVGDRCNRRRTWRQRPRRDQRPWILRKRHQSVGCPPGRPAARTKGAESQNDSDV